MAIKLPTTCMSRISAYKSTAYMRFLRTKAEPDEQRTEQLIKRFWYTRNSPRWGDTVSRLNSFIMKLNHTRADYFSLLWYLNMQFVLISLNDDDVVFKEKEKRIAINEYYIFSQLREGGGAIYKHKGKNKSYRFEEN